MKWNVENLKFLHQPDIFIGKFDNAKMQSRHEEQMQKKLESLVFAIENEEDPFLAMKKLNTRDHIRFLLNNQMAFEGAGRFEEAVLFLYARMNAPFSSGGDSVMWNSLFTSCDRTRLGDLGEPISFTRATLYRGSVSGFMRSLSWTPDRKRAEQFGKRWEDTSLGGGEIYEVDVERDNALICLKNRWEEEIIVTPEFIETAEVRSFQVDG